MSANSHVGVLVAASSQYFSAADSASLSITDDFTLECWVKITATPTGNTDHTIMGKWDSAANKKSYMLQYTNSGGQLRIYLLISSDGSSNTSAFIVRTLTLNTWIHIAVTYDASAGSMELFINGSSDGTGSGLATSINDNNELFQIGCRQSTSRDQFTDMKIDEVRVWDDIRTGTEIANNKNMELVGNEANLVAYYKLNNSLLDETANDNDLTNGGSATFDNTDVPFTGFAVTARLGLLGVGH